MALKIMYRLLAAQNAKRPVDANIKVYDMEADTYENRNAALTALGWPNNSNKDPDMTEKKFKEDMLKDHSVDKIAVIPILIDDVSGKVYELREVEEYDYSSMILSRKLKEVRQKDREIWNDELKGVDLDIRENYEIREEVKKNKEKESVSSSSTSTSVSP